MTQSGPYRHAHAQGPFFHPKDAMRHNRDISGAWTMFVLDKSEGFTQAGVERLNDSIRTYVWAILGAQAQTRSNILKTGTGFDAQKQFLANIEDAIASPVDILSIIARYQKTLQYASTPLDIVFGIGHYLSPSDMALHPGNIQGYNNEIQIAGSDAEIGHNPGITRQSRSPPKAIRHSKGRSPHQPGPFTSGRGLRRTRRLTAQLTMAARQRRNGRAQRPTKKINGPCGRWDSGWPCGALVIISLTSPDQPREAGSPQQWPRPTNFLRAKSQSFPMYSRAKRQLSQ